MLFGESTQGKSLKHTYYFATYGAAFVALGLSLAALGPMLPYLASHVNVSLAQISFLFTASSFGYMIGSAGGGRFYDHFKGHKLMLVAMLFSIIMVVLIPLTSDYYFLLAILLFMGLGQGMLDVGANVSILWVYQARVGPYMNALHFCFGAGAFLSPIILHQVMRWSGGKLTWPFWIVAILSLPSLLGFWLLPSPRNPEKEQAENTAGVPNKSLVAAMVILFFLYVGIEGGFGGWIFSYVTETRIANETSAAYINSVFWGAFTMGRLLAIRLAKNIKPSKLLTGNYIFAIFFLGLILLFPLKPWAIWVSSAGFGLALSSIFPTLLVLGESRLRITGSTTGLFFLGVSLGGTVIPMLLGQIFEFIGSYQVILALFILAGLGLTVLISLLITSNRLGEKVRD
jgi:FHS family Na+ dependent glucose MFS transporter 1